jgi:hypothetical protein
MAARWKTPSAHGTAEEEEEEGQKRASRRRSPPGEPRRATCRPGTAAPSTMDVRERKQKTSRSEQKKKDGA